MDHPAPSLPSVPVTTESLRQAAEAALWHTCLAEAEAMWNELHLRLHADETRKAAFVEFMARNLMNKTTRKRRGRFFSQFPRTTGLAGQDAA